MIRFVVHLFRAVCSDCAFCVHECGGFFVFRGGGVVWFLFLFVLGFRVKKKKAAVLILLGDSAARPV